MNDYKENIKKLYLKKKWILLLEGLTARFGFKNDCETVRHLIDKEVG